MSDYYARSALYHRTIADLSGPRPNEDEQRLFSTMAALVRGEGEPLAVLELGCGAANSAHGLLDVLPCRTHYTGLDMSGVAIESARNRRPDWTLRVGDITALDFEDSTFDVVFLNYVLEHTVYPYKVLSEAVRVLRPGGVIGMIVPVSDLPWLAPPSLRHRARNPLFVVRTTLTRWVELLRLRYSRRYFSFRVLSEPVALRSAPEDFQADDDQIYWGTSFEIQKWLTVHGCTVASRWGRDLTPYIVNGRRPLVDIARRLAFGAVRLSLRERDSTAFTTLLSIVAVK